MSHFGKKTLNFWDWDMLLKNKNFFKTWNQTPKETQLLLLKKWYPIGMIGEYLIGSNTKSGLKIEITGYIEYLWGYKLDVVYIDPNNYIRECIRKKTSERSSA